MDLRSSEKDQQLAMHRRKDQQLAMQRQQGFTLIEVTLAIVLLSGAMVVLLGLQSSIMRRTYVDSQNQLAMMAARQVLSAIEVSDLPVDTQETSGDLKEILTSLISVNAEDEKSLKIFDELSLHLSVSFWGIPTVDEQAMKRVELTVSWSDRPQDALQVVYFFPNDEEASLESGDTDEE